MGSEGEAHTCHMSHVITYRPQGAPLSCWLYTTTSSLLSREEETPSLPGALLRAQEQRLQAEEPEKGPACLSSPSACLEV